MSSSKGRTFPFPLSKETQGKPVKGLNVQPPQRDVAKMATTQTVSTSSSFAGGNFPPSPTRGRRR